MTGGRGGFGLLEISVAALLLGLMLGVVYQALAVQETYRAGGVVDAQEALRTALGTLESELREVSTTGTGIAGSDIGVAATDSVVFRSQGTVAYICDVSRAASAITVATDGAPLAAGDSLLVFVDGDSLRWEDDAWRPAVVSAVTSTVTPTCEARFPDMTVQRLDLPSARSLAGVRLYSPVRPFEWVTFAVGRSRDSTGWSLLRRSRRDGSARPLVDGLAGPGRGLRFEYFDADGNPTAAAGRVARLKIALSTDDGGVDASEPSLSSSLSLRNN